MEITEIVLPGAVEPEMLEVRRRALSPLRAGQALVRVEATGVSFAEVQMRRERYPGQPVFPFVPGYDLVGTVVEVDAPGTGVHVGQRVAAMTMVGAWADHAVIDARDLVPVPAGVDPGDAASLVLNGLTAWKMLHRVARVKQGETVVVHGAAGGVGTTLVQLARLAGIQVIGTASAGNLDRVRALGGIAIDYRSEDLLGQVRALAPDGVAAVFDHVGGDGLRASWQMLGRKGTLVSYGSASTRDDTGSAWTPILRNMGRALLWNLRPGGRWAHMFDVWGRSSLGANRMLRPKRFRRELAEDLGRIFTLLAGGDIEAQVARRFPLEQAGAALRLHESGTISGKIVLVPGMVDAAAERVRGGIAT
jgi:NADPH:quinone reductase-like Zn-dependent oxidoreductase